MSASFSLNNIKLRKSHKHYNGMTSYWQFDSQETKTPMNFSTFIPELKVEKVKGVLLWLSGLTCTEDNFIVKSQAQRWASQNQWMIVCPDTSPRQLPIPGIRDREDFGEGASFYLNATQEPYNEYFQMENFLIKELIPSILKLTKLKSISLSGHSMGGHGALCLGLKFPELFSSISVFAPVSSPTTTEWGINAFTKYLGPQTENQDSWNLYDSCLLLKSGNKHPRPLLIDQGDADPFYQQGRLKTDLLIEACQKNKQPYQYLVRPGFDHSYFYISTFIEEHFAFHQQHISIQ